MKNIKMLAEINPVNYAVMQVTKNATTTKNLVNFKWSDSENDYVASVQPVNFLTYNVKEGQESTVADAETLLYYQYKVMQCESILQKLNDKYLENGTLTVKEQEKEVATKDIKSFYEEIVVGLTQHVKPEVINEISTTPFSCFIVSALTGYYKNSLSVQGIINVLKADDFSVQKLKESVNSVAVEITGKETTFFNRWRMNCTSSLADDIKSRYYKGRQVSKKSGNVIQKYDEKGQIVRTEIILAMLQFLQNKALMSRYTAPEKKDEKK